MTFEADMLRIQKDIEKRYDRALRATMMAMTVEVIGGTPVDTGRAKGNWQVSVGSPNNSVSESNDKTQKNNISGAKIAQANNQISSAIGDVYYLTNNLPYIGVLEFKPEFSNKQEAGWVRGAAQRFIPNLEHNLKVENL